MSEQFARDYVDVATRIAEFHKRYPDGSLQAEIVELTDTRVTVKGRAYRTPDDPRPGEGFAWEPIPGRTPYTRGSELMNAETSAWGRALAALGFEVKNGVASAEEVRSAQPSRAAAQPRPAPSSQAAVVVGPWAEGASHDPEHKPLRSRQNGTLYCPTKLPNGSWCNFRADAASASVPAAPAPSDEPPPPTDEELATLASLPF